MKQYISLMICLLLVISLAIPAFATESGLPSVDMGTGDNVFDDSFGEPDTEGDSSGSEGGEGPGEELGGSEDSTGTEPGGDSGDVHQHSWDAGTVTTAPTCTEGGVKTYACACGATSTEALAATGHAYGSWTQSEGGHSRSCGTCGATEKGDHSMTQTVTPGNCKEKGIQTNTCSACGYSTTKELSLGDHLYGEWDGDAVSHFRICSVCGNSDAGKHSWADTVVTVAPTCKEEGATARICTLCEGAVVEVLPKLTTHTYDNACDPECNVCKETREVEHKFSSAWSRNSRDHWHACKVCGAKKDEADHYPGPAATEEKDQICLTCGYIMTPKLKHTHKYSDKWSSDQTSHWYACAGCEDQKNLADHQYDDLCDPDCNICGYTTATAHQLDDAWSSDETGHWTACVLCGEETALEAHTADPNVGADDAQVCTVCSYLMAPAKVHTHEAAGAWNHDTENHWKLCDCGEEVDKAAHTWDEGTENEDTTVTYRCTECGEVRTEGEPKAPASASGFPFGLVLAILGVIALGLLIALIVVIRSEKKSAGKFNK